MSAVGAGPAHVGVAQPRARLTWQRSKHRLLRLASLVLNEADPVEWGDIEVLPWPEAGIIAKPGSAGFVIIDRITGRQWVVEVKERESRSS